MRRHPRVRQTSKFIPVGHCRQYLLPHQSRNKTKSSYRRPKALRGPGLRPSRQQSAVQRFCEEGPDVLAADIRKNDYARHDEVDQFRCAASTIG
jgi:hypothetical protein